jgi:hypothetical protein
MASLFQNTMLHKGPGIVWYSSYANGPFHDGRDSLSRVESEEQYKRHYYLEYGFMLALGISIWIAIGRLEQRPGG